MASTPQACGEPSHLVNTAVTPSSHEGDLLDLQRSLEAVRDDLLALEARLEPELRLVPEARRGSARNLVHYVALRRHDLRALQERLVALGLSSLGRAEAHVLATLEAVLGHLSRLTGRAASGAVEPPGAPGQAQDLLERRTRALLGPQPVGRRVRVLATLPVEAARDPGFVRALLAAGTDLVRINCGHDDAAAWARMVEHTRGAARALGRECGVFMDLAGPKLRTGPLEPGPRVVTWRPERDPLGRVLEPARVWLTPVEAPAPPPGPAAATLQVPRRWLEALASGDEAELIDARGKRRRLQVREGVPGGGASRWAQGDKRAYVVPGTVLRHTPRPPGRAPSAGTCTPQGVPALEQALRLRAGDLLLVTRDQVPGRSGVGDEPARIGCTLPALLEDVRQGDRVAFDDGRLSGLVERADARGVLVRLTQVARSGGEALRADKGINLPDLSARAPALTARDREDLAFVARHADLVGLSFVHAPSDVDALRGALAACGAPELGLVLKIETRAAFDALPALLLAALRHPRAGVMIARGDLAVECGFERLAEAQEEILWMCEAAHVPVIWATQVLEQLTRSGQPSRAEITDAAMGERAECVMLNKGAHLVGAVTALDDVLRRMQDHQSKKRAMLRPLRLAARFSPDP